MTRDADDPPKGTAIIADPRNDQTLIILQLHVAMQKFHNRLVDVLRMHRGAASGGVRVGSAHGPMALPVDCDPRVPAGHRGHRPWPTRCTRKPQRAPIINLKYYKPTNPAGRSFIPVEFAVAAYRFGHSITRPRYTVRDVYNTTGTTVLGSVSSVPLFEDAPSENNLNGHRDLLPASAEDSVEQVLQRAG